MRGWSIVRNSLCVYGVFALTGWGFSRMRRATLDMGNPSVWVLKSIIASRFAERFPPADLKICSPTDKKTVVRHLPVRTGNEHGRIKYVRSHQDRR